RIEDDAERTRLREMVEACVAHQEAPNIENGGYIIRTAAEGASLDALRADMLFLNKLWESVQSGMKNAKAGTLVHEDLPLPVRILRDLLDSEVEQVRVDSKMTWERMREFTQMFIPDMTNRIELYGGDRPIFDFY